jgi:hypothetical protein
MADTALAPDDLCDRLARRAIAGASRRRRITQGSVAGMAAAAVAGSVLVPVLRQGSDATPGVMHSAPPAHAGPVQSLLPGAPLHAELPANTPADTQLVHACLKHNTVPPNGQNDDLSRPGDHRDHFRVLATANLTYGDLAVFLGSTAGHLVCLLDRNHRTIPPDRASGQVAGPWEESFAAFRGPLKVDDGGGGILGDLAPPSESRNLGWELHLAGRVDTRVSTMTFTSPAGVTRSAGVSHGFFVWVERGKGDSVPADDSVKAKVDLYGAGGAELGSTTVEVPPAMFTNPDTSQGGGL